MYQTGMVTPLLFSLFEGSGYFTEIQFDQHCLLPAKTSTLKQQMPSATMISRQLLFLWITVVLLSSCHGHLHVTILHTSDISSRFEPVNNQGTECTGEAECYGGMARIATVVEETRKERKGAINVLLLDAGDMLIGEYFNIYRGNATAQIMNKMGYDAMAIGNEEIAIGPDALVPFLEMANFSVVSANLDASREPILEVLFSKSEIKTYINKDGSEERVGIVGYTTERANDIAYVRNAVFTDVIEAVQAEVDALTEQGIDQIIVLGHSWGIGDISMDLEIAKTVSGVDIVVGGGVNYFHFDGCPPDTEEACNTYPIVVIPDDNPKGKVLVVHSPIWGKYLGRLNVMFNKYGHVSEWYGNPILVNVSIAEDPVIVASITEFNEGVSNFSNSFVGRTHVYLEGYPRSVCRVGECNMGNLITTAMVWKWATSYEGEDLEGWTNVATAVFNSGGIRSSIDQGNILYRDLVDVLPFSNTFDTIDLQGRYVLEMLEHSAAGYGVSGQFLQMAGMRVIYDVSKDPYDDRVVEVMVLCTKCDYPQYVPLDEDEMYTLAVPSFLAEGYDGYDVIADNAVNRQIGEGDISVLIEYLEKWSPVYTGLEGRIKFVNPTVDQTNVSVCAATESSTPAPSTATGAATSTSKLMSTIATMSQSSAGKTTSAAGSTSKLMFTIATMSQSPARKTTSAAGSTSKLMSTIAAMAPSPATAGAASESTTNIMTTIEGLAPTTASSSTTGASSGGGGGEGGSGNPDKPRKQ